MLPRRLHRTTGLPIALGENAIAITACGRDCLEWRITAEGARPGVGILVLLSAEDVIELGRRSVDALEAYRR